MSSTTSSTSGSSATIALTASGSFVTEHLLPAIEATGELGAEGGAQGLGLALDCVGGATDLPAALVEVDGVAEEHARVQRALLQVDVGVAGVTVPAQHRGGDLGPRLGDAVDVELEGLGDRPLRGRDHHVGVVDGGGEREAAASALGPDAAVALHLHVHRESPVGDPAGA